MPNTTSPFHDPRAEPVQPIRVELDDRTLDPFAGLQIEETGEVRPAPQSQALVASLTRSGTPRYDVHTLADLGVPGPLVGRPPLDGAPVSLDPLASNRSGDGEER